MLSMKVFINPVVAALPEHANLFPEFGCFESNGPGLMINHKECGEGKGGELETRLDPSFYPLPLTLKMDRDWENEVKKNVHFVSNRKPNNPLVVTDLSNTTINAPESSDTKRAESDSANFKGSDPRARDHPLMRFRERKLTASELPVLPVAVWPYLEMGIGNAEALHIEENGVNESKYLTLADNMLALDDPNVVWVGDTGYPYGWNFWCGEYLKWVKEAKKERVKRGMPLSWPIFVVDFTDGPTTQRCRDIEEEIGSEFVFYSTRSIVRERIFSNATNWVDSGHLMALQMQDGRSYLHTPLIARTDTVDSLREVLLHRYNMTLDGPIESIERKVDVSHFWRKTIDEQALCFYYCSSHSSLFSLRRSFRWLWSRPCPFESQTNGQRNYRRDGQK